MSQIKARDSRLKRFLRQRETGLVLVIIALIALVSLRNPNFSSLSNLQFILGDTSIMIVLALGMMCVLLVGSIDISISGIMALGAMTAGIVMKNNLVQPEAADALRTSTPLILLILISMGVGALCGAINGLLISYGKVLPIVATLGMQYIIYGTSHVISGGQAVYRKDMSEAFIQFTRGSFLGLNSKVWIMLAAFIILYLFITYTKAGRHLYAVGSNREAAQMSGIKPETATLNAHIIMGALAGLAGMMYASHDNKVTQDMAMGYEMYVIAACVIGGVSVTGGSGKILGVLLGALTIGVINNGLTMLRLTGNSEFWKKAIQGAVILIAVVTNVLISRGHRRRVLRERRI
ncbi:MAG: ABC transporter permease [Bacillota bacterium]|nr:ABC transporter permease [Bacillota bacterium]